jgi:hypothetical protein
MQVVFTGEIPVLRCFIRRVVSILPVRIVLRFSIGGRMLWRLGIGLVVGVGHK